MDERYICQHLLALPRLSSIAIAELSFHEKTLFAEKRSNLQIFLFAGERAEYYRINSAVKLIRMYSKTYINIKLEKIIYIVQCE